MKSWILTFLIFCMVPALNAEEKEPYLVKTKNFHVKSFSLKEITFGNTAVIYNPYKAKVKLDEILIDVFVADKKLGTIMEAEAIKINKVSAFDLPLQITVKTGPTVTALFSEAAKIALTGKKIKVDYKGYVKVKAAGFIPVKVRIDQTEYFSMKDILGSSKEEAKPAQKQQP
jgi:LEA14-like dessication related protein